MKLLTANAPWRNLLFQVIKTTAAVPQEEITKAQLLREDFLNRYSEKDMENLKRRKL